VTVSPASNPSRFQADVSVCGAHLAGASRFAQLGRDLLQSVRH
jgi:hypothetical protein